MDHLVTSRFVAAWPTSPFGHADDLPWRIVQSAEHLIVAAIGSLGPDYRIAGNVSVHRSATLESGSVIKGPAIIGPRCFLAGGSYLRGGTFLADDCVVGPGAELKTSFVFQGSKIAHLNFVGDTILGADVNIEAGAVIANYRNELADKTIRILVDGTRIDTGVEKFGALVGDGTRIGANAVLAPGTLLYPGTKVGRLQLVDQCPH